MSQSYEQLSAALDQLELRALEHPEQLFPLSYVRSHLDLLDEEVIELSMLDSLRLAVSSTFDADKMSEEDRAAVLALIDSLASL